MLHAIKTQIVQSWISDWVTSQSWMSQHSGQTSNAARVRYDIRRHQTHLAERRQNCHSIHESHLCITASGAQLIEFEFLECNRQSADGNQHRRIPQRRVRCERVSDSCLSTYMVDWTAVTQQQYAPVATIMLHLDLPARNTKMYCVAVCRSSAGRLRYDT